MCVFCADDSPLYVHHESVLLGVTSRLVGWRCRFSGFIEVIVVADIFFGYFVVKYFGEVVNEQISAELISQVSEGHHVDFVREEALVSFAFGLDQ